MIAEKQKEIADKNAQIVQAEADAEEEIKDVLAMRRNYQLMNQKLGVLNKMGENGKVKIFGNQNADAITQMAASRIANV